MFSVPQHTQIPNKLLDELIPTLKEGEVRILLVIMRQTYGWHKEWDRISITFLMKKTGMERKAVCKSTESLVKKNMIKKDKIGKCGTEKVYYSLCLISDEKTEEKQQKIETNSNKLYQYPKDTGTSILKIPSKETLTKEIKQKESTKEKTDPPAPKGEQLGQAQPSPIYFSLEEMKLKIEKKELENLKALYPHVNLEEEILKCETWYADRPKIIKRRKDWRRALHNWLDGAKSCAPKEKTEQENIDIYTQNWIYEKYKTYLETCNDPIYIDRSIRIEDGLIKLGIGEVVLGKVSISNLLNCLRAGRCSSYFLDSITSVLEKNNIKINKE